MINLEKYKDEIIRAGSMFGVDADGKIRNCCNIECKQCRLNDNVHNCYKARIEWMLEEAPLELLPCPFCGGEAKICSAGFDAKYIRCSNVRGCGCKFEWFVKEEEAIEAWNRRTL